MGAWGSLVWESCRHYTLTETCVSWSSLFRPVDGGGCPPWQGAGWCLSGLQLVPRAISLDLSGPLCWLRVVSYLLPAALCAPVP